MHKNFSTAELLNVEISINNSIKKIINRNLIPYYTRLLHLLNLNF